MPLTLITDPADGQARCSWCASSADYRAYHDDEWGLPVGDGGLGDDQRLFEKLVLEGFQSGLSWITILRKREGFRAAFNGAAGVADPRGRGLDFAHMATLGEPDVRAMLGNPAIVRHRGKIEAALHNARCAVKLQAEAGSLAAFVWQFEPPPGQRPDRVTPEVAATLTHSAQSTALSKALKQRGWKFVGPTTMYAFMQSMGLVNDHLEGCAARATAEAARSAFQRPAVGTGAVA
jgi:DNA-3-methyladenine glycosylase I